MSEEKLCAGSGRKWKLGVNRHCPVCTKSSATLAVETNTTGNGGRIPSHKKVTR